MDFATDSNQYDVVIAGGGMVGATLALALARRLPELRIAVVDRFSPRPQSNATNATASFDGRSTVLSEGSRRILESLQVWENLVQFSTSITDIHVSERGAFGSAHLTAQEHGWPAMGYVIENVQLGKVLFSEIQNYSSIDFFGGANVAAIKNHLHTSEVVIEKNDQSTVFNAELVIVADGVGSKLRESLGISADSHDYSQIALIANVGFSNPHNGYAYERFTDWGPMALLPLSDSQNVNRAALIWTMDKSRAEELVSCSEDNFLSCLQQRFGYRQGRFLRVGERYLYPLMLDAAKEQVRHRLVVLGNAAHTLHPVAGQGFNLSLRDTAVLVDTLVDAKSKRQSPGDLSVLQGYLQRRQFDQRNTTNFSHQLIQLFSSENIFVKQGRRVGLLALDNFPALKSMFTDLAAGTAAWNRS